MLTCHAGLNWGQTDRILGGARCVHGITAAVFVPNCPVYHAQSYVPRTKTSNQFSERGVLDGHRNVIVIP